MPASASNKLPELSKAKPTGKLNPETNVVIVPLGVTFMMLPAPAASGAEGAGRVEFEIREREE